MLRLGLLQDGDVGVGVFPEREEVLLGSLRLDYVALHDVGTTCKTLRMAAMSSAPFDLSTPA
jgi:hypothetical protein